VKQRFGEIKASLQETLEKLSAPSLKRTGELLESAAPIAAAAITHAPALARGKAMAEAPEKAVLLGARVATSIGAPALLPAVSSTTKAVERNIDDSREPAHVPAR
jgi:hypothetical protein